MRFDQYMFASFDVCFQKCISIFCIAKFINDLFWSTNIGDYRVFLSKHPDRPNMMQPFRSCVWLVFQMFAPPPTILKYGFPYINSHATFKRLIYFIGYRFFYFRRVLTNIHGIYCKLATIMMWQIKFIYIKKTPKRSMN